MTNLVKTLKVLFLVLTPYLLSNCTKNENQIPPEINGDWKVISFDDNVALTKVYKTSNNTWPDFNNGDITMNLNISSSTVGDISGRNVTNSFSGKFEISSDSKIVVNKLLWTLIGEPTWGQLFHSIESAETYELTGNNLVIYYNQKKNSITLERFGI
jgi:hypothetical protein